MISKNKQSMESKLDIQFVATLALKEKQIQQNYRPIIGIHKWFARRPGTVFRALMLAEFGKNLNKDFFLGHNFEGVIGDPFMGGGTPTYEANRLGFGTVSCDVNPMAHWIVSRALEPLDTDKFRIISEVVIKKTEDKIGRYFKTKDNTGRIRDVKYFILIKQRECPNCNKFTDLIPGYLLAENVRHPKNVIICSCCGELNEIESKDKPGKCTSCKKNLIIYGNAKGNSAICKFCNTQFKYQSSDYSSPPKHRLWAIEYHCPEIKGKGRFFKSPDEDDLNLISESEIELNRCESTLPIPDDEIPVGDETKRLHRWGYGKFRELFTDRQLLGLGVLGREISQLKESPEKRALITVFSDILRYQNLLCRYDTYALKCQDIFSVHGFPVALTQCENNILGIPGVGSGGFCHFIEKYIRAKTYCKAPFETVDSNGQKQIIPIIGETIEAQFAKDPKSVSAKIAYIANDSSEKIILAPNSLDAVFTDPPYFDNVQYAELMDFCFCWLKKLVPKYSDRKALTKSEKELTGNDTTGKGIFHFTDGLSKVFSNFAIALKPNAPFTFTYHHNDPQAYIPLVVAILDSELNCTASIPVPAEMSASMHIANSKSSTLDTVFINRRNGIPGKISIDSICDEIQHLIDAGVKIRNGDIRCILTGNFTRIAVNELYANGWDREKATEKKIELATSKLNAIFNKYKYESWVENVSGRMLNHG